ncbi:hypothetical protein Ancab_003627 [Ancistrocladus abbreviatus]
MPQRHLTVKASEPTPLRRSPRLFQLKNPPKPQDSSTPKSRSCYNLVVPRNFDSPPVSLRTRSSLKKMVQNDCAQKSSESFYTGWRSCRKSINQSRKASTLGSGVEVVRRSPRLLSLRISREYVDKAADGKSNPSISYNVNGDLVVSETGKSKLSENGTAVVELNKLVSRYHHSVPSGVTPLKGGEGKPRSIKERNANGNYSSKQNVGNLEGQTTRIIVAALAAERQEGNDSRDRISGGSRKMVMRSSVGALAMRPSEDKGKIKEVDSKGEEGSNSDNQIVGKLGASGCSFDSLDATPDVGKKNTRKTGKGFGVIGVKRKRQQMGGIDQGWTKEQELALERAYFSAKPTPHFWKKVAKLVPGKSAQECFDKVNSSTLTPTAQRPRSRARKTKSSPLSDFSYSASKMLISGKPKGDKVCWRKQKSHVAQKTVRHLLQKYCRVDEDDAADLFSVLEPNANPSAPVIQQTTALLTPVREMENLRSSPMHRERSSSGHRKRLSRFSGTCGTSLISPPVLKQVKNMALHEKYIDQLHNREAKRKASSLRHVKSSSKEDKKQSSARKRDAIQAAKSALVSDARDAISRFQHLQVNIMEKSSDFEECSDDEDDDVDEKVF